MTYSESEYEAQREAVNNINYELDHGNCFVSDVIRLPKCLSSIWKDCIPYGEQQDRTCLQIIESSERYKRKILNDKLDNTQVHFSFWKGADNGSRTSSSGHVTVG